MNTLANTAWSLTLVLAAGLVLGAGLPALYVVGIRLLAGKAEADTVAAATKPARLAGVVCLVLVVAAIVVGILFVMQDFLASTFHVHLF